MKGKAMKQMKPLEQQLLDVYSQQTRTGKIEFLRMKRDAEKEKDETLKAKKWGRLFKKYKI